MDFRCEVGGSHLFFAGAVQPTKDACAVSLFQLDSPSKNTASSAAFLLVVCTHKIAAW